MKNSAISCRPFFQPLSESCTEQGIEPELPKKVSKHSVIETVVARSQIKTRGLMETVRKRLASGIIERAISLRPALIELNG